MKLGLCYHVDLPFHKHCRKGRQERSHKGRDEHHNKDGESEQQGACAHVLESDEGFPQHTDEKQGNRR